MELDDWKKQALIEMQKFEEKLYNKIKGLNCMVDMTNYNREITKQIEDIIDTIYVDISHIHNFNKIINDNNIPISNIIKRKKAILNKNVVVSISIPDTLDKHFIEFINNIRYDGDIHANNDQALYRAAINGHLDVVECLIKYGADIHASNNRSLINASYYGRLSVVEYLIAHGADIHANEDSALIYASENGHLDIIKCLISHGANVHARNDLALRWASENGHTAVIKLLTNYK
jgi:ankyrin repeat protein